jgi:hypothetical protein
MSVHDVVVFTGDIEMPSKRRDEPPTTVMASVAICRDCPWRGPIRNTEREAHVDKIPHQRATAVSG